MIFNNILLFGLRSGHAENTGSQQITEVKQR